MNCAGVFIARKFGVVHSPDFLQDKGRATLTHLELFESGYLRFPISTGELAASASLGCG